MALLLPTASKMTREVLVALTLLCLTDLVTESDSQIFKYGLEERRSAKSFLTHFRQEDIAFGFKYSQDNDRHNTTTNNVEGGKGINGLAKAVPSHRAQKVIFSLSNIYLHLYRRCKEQEMVSGDDWFINFDRKIDVAIVVHGGGKKSTKNGMETISKALLKDRILNVIAVNWTYYLESNNGYTKETEVYISKLIGHALYLIFRKHFPTFLSDKRPQNYFIGDDLGIVTAITFAEFYNKPFQYVYGLLPRDDLEGGIFQRQYILTQQHGGLVITLHDYEHDKYSYGHRSYLIGQGKKNPKVEDILSLFLEAIGNGEIEGRFCTTAEQYKKGYCDNLNTAPLWFSHDFEKDRNYPTGKYFLNIPKDNIKCDCT